MSQLIVHYPNGEMPDRVIWTGKMADMLLHLNDRERQIKAENAKPRNAKCQTKTERIDACNLHTVMCHDCGDYWKIHKTNFLIIK